MGLILIPPDDFKVSIDASAVDSDESNFIIGASAVEPFPAAAGAFTIKSDSAADAAAGAGARSVFAEVIHQDLANPTDPKSFSIRQEVIDLDGLNSVTGFDTIGGEGVWRVRRMFVKSGDRELFHPTGTITASVGGVPVSDIDPGRGRAQLAVWTSGPDRIEEVHTVGLRITTGAGQGGLDWEVSGTFFSRNPDGNWLALASADGREPTAKISSDLAEPVALSPVQDIMFKVEATSGVTRTIRFFMQISTI